MILSLTSAVEAILFAAGSEGIRTADLADILELPRDEVAALCQELQQQYGARGAGLQVMYADPVWQLVTNPAVGPYLRRMANDPKSAQLSHAALEVLAIVAYRQPISRLDVEAIRGVQSDRAIATLAHRQLIREVGRMEAPGRPILYGTTPLFLQSFGFQSLADLPPAPQSPTDLPAELNLFDLNSANPRD